MICVYVGRLPPIPKLKLSRKCKSGGDPVIASCTIGTSELYLGGRGIDLCALRDLRKWVRIKGIGGVGLNTSQVGSKKPLHLILRPIRRMRFGGKQKQLMTIIATGPCNGMKSELNIGFHDTIGPLFNF